MERFAQSLEFFLGVKSTLKRQEELGVSYDPNRDDQQIKTLTEMMHLAPIRQDLEPDFLTLTPKPTSSPPPTDPEAVKATKRPQKPNQWAKIYVAPHAVLPLMKAQGRGHIVNISSVGRRTTCPSFGVYNATKWGVGAFSEALRQEVHKDKIRVTSIEPGAVATELAEHITDPAVKEGTKAFYQSLTPLEGEDVAAAILYAATQPPRVNVNEILLLPTEQER